MFLSLWLLVFYSTFMLTTHIWQNEGMVFLAVPSPPLYVEFCNMLFCHHSFPPSLWALALIDFVLIFHWFLWCVVRWPPFSFSPRSPPLLLYCLSCLTQESWAWKQSKYWKGNFYTIYKTKFIGIDLRQIFRTSNTPHPTQFWHFFSQFRDFVTSRCLKLSDYYIFDRKIFYMSYMKSIKMSLMWNLPPKTPVYVGQCQCPKKICFYCDNCFYLDSSKLCL